MTDLVDGRGVRGVEFGYKIDKFLFSAIKFADIRSVFVVESKNHNKFVVYRLLFSKCGT